MAEYYLIRATSGTSVFTLGIFRGESEVQALKQGVAHFLAEMERTPENHPFRKHIDWKIGVVPKTTEV